MKAFEELVFIILIDLEEKVDSQVRDTRPVIYSPNAQNRPQDKLRPFVLKHLEAYEQYTRSLPFPEQHACRRWVRQLLFSLRDPSSIN